MAQQNAGKPSESAKASSSGQGSPTEAFAEAAERAREFNERILENAQKTVREPLEREGQTALRRYVEWLDGVADEQKKFASTPEVKDAEGITAMLNAQADFTTEFASSLRRFANLDADANKK